MGLSTILLALLVLPVVHLYQDVISCAEYDAAGDWEPLCVGKNEEFKTIAEAFHFLMYNKDLSGDTTFSVMIRKGETHSISDPSYFGGNGVHFHLDKPYGKSDSLGFNFVLESFGPSSDSNAIVEFDLDNDGCYIDHENLPDVCGLFIVDQVNGFRLDGMGITFRIFSSANYIGVSSSTMGVFQFRNLKNGSTINPFGAYICTIFAVVDLPNPYGESSWDGNYPWLFTFHGDFQWLWVEDIKIFPPDGVASGSSKQGVFMNGIALYGPEGGSVPNPFYSCFDGAVHTAPTSEEWSEELAAFRHRFRRMSFKNFAGGVAFDIKAVCDVVIEKVDYTMANPQRSNGLTYFVQLNPGARNIMIQNNVIVGVTTQGGDAPLFGLQVTSWGEPEMETRAVVFQNNVMFCEGNEQLSDTFTSNTYGFGPFVVYDFRFHNNLFSNRCGAFTMLDSHHRDGSTDSLTIDGFIFEQNYCVNDEDVFGMNWNPARSCSGRADRPLTVPLEGDDTFKKFYARQNSLKWNSADNDVYDYRACGMTVSYNAPEGKGVIVYPENLIEGKKYDFSPTHDFEGNERSGSVFYAGPVQTRMTAPFNVAEFFFVFGIIAGGVVLCTCCIVVVLIVICVVRSKLKKDEDEDEDFDPISEKEEEEEEKEEEKEKSKHKKKKQQVKEKKVELETELLELTKDEKVKLFGSTSTNILQFSDLEVTEEIGIGGSNSTVYKASWSGQTVAVKIFRLMVKEFFSDENEVSLKREMKLMASLAHPHVVGFFGVVYDKIKFGLVMEFCGMGDIKRFIKKFFEVNLRKFLLKEKLVLCRDIAAGMAYLNSKEIIHRDLKCENVLMSSTQEKFVPKIMDFGLSRSVTDQQSKTFAIGTSKYMAPEICLGKEYDFKCDVYSFAIMMYEIITENFDPFSTKSSSQLRGNVHFKAANDPSFRPPVKEMKGRCPDWFLILTKKSWSADSEDRDSFKELVEIMKGRISEAEITIYIKERDQTEEEAEDFEFSRDSSIAELKEFISEKVCKSEGTVVKLLSDGIELVADGDLWLLENDSSVSYVKKDGEKEAETDEEGSDSSVELIMGSDDEPTDDSSDSDNEADD